MAKKSVFELETDADLTQWHDDAYAEYEQALEAYSKATSSKAPSSEVDPKIKKNYEEARDNLVAGTQYWRQVGEVLGTRQGIAIVEEDED